MSTPEQQQITNLTNKLNALENESRRILRALNWATKVRTILFFVLLLFVLISCAMFYWLYMDVRENRVAEIQQIIANKPEEFSEPLALQLKQLAESKGPDVAAIFRQQMEQDAKLYAAEFDAQRSELISNLQQKLEGKLINTYAAMLDEQEQILKDEFPVLEDPEKLENIRNNMELVYRKISQRYYVDFLKSELEELAVKLDGFPASDPRIENVPVTEQIATEFLELVRMMLVYADNYQIPDDVEQTSAVDASVEEIPKPDASASSDDDDSRP